MKLWVIPASPRAFKVMALTRHLKIECDMQHLDPGKGDQRAAPYLAMNPNGKMPLLEDAGLRLWESNAILVYLASISDSRLWPKSAREQASVVRWLCWEAAHWDQESIGMVGYELVSKRVLGIGPPDLEFIARGRLNFVRFAAVLDECLKCNHWLNGDSLSLADFAVGAWVPAARAFDLPVRQYPQIMRWHDALSDLPGWREPVTAFRECTDA